MSIINGQGRVGIRSGAAPSTPTYPTSLKLFIDAGNPLSYSGTGTTFTDLSGNGNNGTLINGVGYSSSNGGVLVLDGVNDYISFNKGSFRTMFADNATFTTWFTYTDISGSNRFVFSDYISSGSGQTARLALNAFAGVAGKMGGSLCEEGGQHTSSTTTTIVANLWYHIAMSYDGVTQKIYLNGVLESQLNHAITSGAGVGNFTIGRPGDYNGLYAPIKLGTYQGYNSVLTPTEITANFNEFKSRYGY